MFGRIFSKKPTIDLAYEIYGGLVSRARNPVFYRDLAVPDTLNGRLDLMVMHVFLLSLRLKDSDETCRALSQEVFDAFLLDMDRGLREEGVGDVTVPKRIKTMTQIFYGRVGAYEKPVLDGDKKALAVAINRNIFTDAHDDENSNRLAGYMLRLHAHLTSLSNDQLLRAELSLDIVAPVPAEK
jgi:cytochrome b pre-mRNA-processing protein 3